MKKIKILYIHHGSGIGGAPISLLNLLKQLDNSLFDFKVAFVNDGKIVEIFKHEKIKTFIINGSNNWFVHNEPGKIKLFNILMYVKILKTWRYVAIKEAPKFLRLQEFDILHLNSHVMTSWAYAAKKINKKVIIHNREAISTGYFGFRKKVLQNLIHHYCDAVINISHDNYNRLGLEDKSHVVYNFITLPKAFRKPFTSNAIKILYLGGNAKIKGFRTAVESLQYLNKNIVVQFAGTLNTWNTPKTIKDYIINIIKMVFYRPTYAPLRKLKRAANVEMLGLLKDPYPYIDNCDILITPFIVEHFSRPAMEAFAYGKPVIGSDVAGMNEIIDHNVNGLLVEKNNPKDLANAINFLSENPNIAQEMGEKGRKKAESLFSPEINTKKVENIYLKLMGK